MFCFSLLCFSHSRCSVCRRRNDSFITRLEPLDSTAREFRRGYEHVAPAPRQQQQQPTHPRRTNPNRRPVNNVNGRYGSRNRYPRSDTTAP